MGIWLAEKLIEDEQKKFENLQKIPRVIFCRSLWGSQSINRFLMLVIHFQSLIYLLAFHANFLMKFSCQIYLFSILYCQIHIKHRGLMRMKNFTLTALATTAALSCAAFLPADTTMVQLGVGYRQDSITLNIKERGNINPRAKSDRHFKNLEIVTLGTQLRSTLGCSDAYVRGSFDWGWVVDGDVRDQLSIEDFDSNPHQFHHAGYSVEGDFLNTTVHNDVKESSYVWDFDVAFGYPFHCGCEDHFTIAPVVGFAINHQHLKVKGRTAFSDVSFSSSEREEFDLKTTCKRNSNFRANWWGPYLGFDFVYNSPDCWNLYGAFEFHFGRARRVANSHTEREYIDSFRRTKIFYGPLFRLGTYYMLCENWYVDASVAYQKYFSDTNRDKISWSSGSVRVDLGYIF